MDASTLTELKSLRSRAIRHQTQIRLKNSPMALWPHLAEKDLLLARIGMGKARYHFENHEQGGTLVSVDSAMMGMIPSRYIELPYEWSPPSFTSAERIYLKGPLRYLALRWDSEGNSDSGCTLTITLRYVPRYPMPMDWLMRMTLKRILAVHRETDDLLRTGNDWGYETFFQPPETHRPEIERLAERWRGLSPDGEIRQGVAEYLVTAPEKLAARLRPFEVADHMHLDRLDTLRFFLQGTRAGHFDMSWEIMCPSCRGANSAQSHLSDLEGEAHCDVCNIRYDASFDQNVEVVFHPTVSSRKAKKDSYCLLNPGGLRHLWAQINTEPSQTRPIQLHLPRGHYRLRSPTLKGVLEFETGPSGAKSLVIALKGSLARHDTPPLSEDPELILDNPQDFLQTIKIEHLAHRNQAASAALVTSLQEFRDLFSSEALRPGVRLGISNLTFLFTDLKDSTQLYEDRGDAGAFSLVQHHFDILQRIIGEHEGGVVKTIGDAIMAVFSNEQRAIDAGIEILCAFDHYNHDHPENPSLIVKLGIHKGPCIALNLNDKLDYFGSTINRAARAQGQGVGSDLVLTSEVYEIFTAPRGITVTPFEAELKGIGGMQTLYRVRRNPE